MLWISKFIQASLVFNWRIFLSEGLSRILYYSKLFFPPGLFLNASISDFPCFWWPWQILRHIGRFFCTNSFLGSAIFSQDYKQTRGSGRKTSAGCLSFCSLMPFTDVWMSAHFRALYRMDAWTEDHSFLVFLWWCLVKATQGLPTILLLFDYLFLVSGKNRLSYGPYSPFIPIDITSFFRFTPGIYEGEK